MEWPSKSDRPYLPTSKAWMLPDMRWTRYVGNANYLYINGYRRAAELLQAEVLRTGGESLVFPLLFMWRQHIEL
jgi:hypothetical protein